MVDKLHKSPGLVTEAVLKKTKVKCIGLCNVPVNMQVDAEKAQSKKGSCNAGLPD